MSRIGNRVITIPENVTVSVDANIVKVRGMDIVMVTTAKTNEEAYDLLKGFGMPFKK